MACHFAIFWLKQLSSPRAERPRKYAQSMSTAAPRAPTPGAVPTGGFSGEGASEMGAVEEAVVRPRFRQPAIKTGERAPAPNRSVSYAVRRFTWAEISRKKRCRGGGWNKKRAFLPRKVNGPYGGRAFSVRHTGDPKRGFVQPERRARGQVCG